MTRSALILLIASVLFALAAAAPFVLDTSAAQKVPVANEAVQLSSDLEYKDLPDEEVDVTVRRAFQSDVQHEWILEEATGGFACPRNITHTTWNLLPSGIIGINHNTIIQDNTRCESNDSERRLEFYESQLYDESLNPVRPDVAPMPDFLKTMLTTTGANINMMFDHRMFGEEFLIGYEALLRVCGTNTAWQPGTTAFLSRPFNRVYTTQHLETKFEPGYKYMVMVPRYQEAYCVYRVFTPVDPSAEPELDVTPGPVLPIMSTPPIADLPTDIVTPEPSPEMSVSPEPSSESATESDAEESDPVCFPADAVVTLDSGAKVPIHTLAAGDRVLVGANKFSTVHGFTHNDRHVRSKFVQLTLASGASLRASAGHFVPTADGRTEPASKLVVGDMLLGADGVASAIVQKDIVTDAGLYNPQTTSGTIVVDGVVATTYTTAVPVLAAHSLLMPLRALFASCGVDPLPRLLAAGISRVVQ